MTWAALIQAIVAFLAPVIQEWLKHLLERLEPRPVEYLVPDDAALVATVFAEARRQVPWYSFGRRAVLRAAERVCKRRAGELVLAAAGAAPVPQMTAGEALEVGRE